MSDKVTTKILREMLPGEVRAFAFDDCAAIENGKALAYRAQHRLGCRFKAKSNYAEKTLVLIKQPLP